MSDSRHREEALRSALARLPIAVLLVDERRTLQALNRKAVALLEREGLGADLITSRPGHPLSALVSRVLGATTEPVARVELLFPGGNRYFVEPSHRSEKGLERWLVLLVEPAQEAGVPVDRILGRWRLTGRELEVAKLMARGSASAEMCEVLRIAPTTLKTHVRQVLSKTGSRTRADFLAKLIRSERE